MAASSLANSASETILQVLSLKPTRRVPPSILGDARTMTFASLSFEIRSGKYNQLMRSFVAGDVNWPKRDQPLWFTYFVFARSDRDFGGSSFSCKYICRASETCFRFDNCTAHTPFAAGRANIGINSPSSTKPIVTPPSSRSQRSLGFRGFCLSVSSFMNPLSYGG